jgi:hypothetical protein
MKKMILVLGFLFITNICFADVSFIITAKDTDENGNIRVWTCHKIDGVEVESRYPKMDCTDKDGKTTKVNVWATRYNKQNLANMTATQAETYILNDIQGYSKVLIQKEFDKKAPKTLQQIQVDYNRVANEAVSNTTLKDLVGKGMTMNETIQKIDTDLDGKADTDITIKPDGSLTQKAITVE